MSLRWLKKIDVGRTVLFYPNHLEKDLKRELKKFVGKINHGSFNKQIVKTIQLRLKRYMSGPPLPVLTRRPSRKPRKKRKAKGLFNPRVLAKLQKVEEFIKSRHYKRLTKRIIKNA